MFRKMMVLAMALGVAAALALPASGSASWKHHATPIQQDVQLGLTGKVRFKAPSLGIECQITSSVRFSPGTTATAETFDVHPQDETVDCKVETPAQCQLHNLTPQAPNWVVHTTPFQTILAVHSNGQTTFGTQNLNAAVVTVGTLEGQLTGSIFCVFKKIVLHPNIAGLVEAGGADGSTVTNLDVNGSAQATIETSSGATHTEETLIQGTLQVEAPNQNTYSL